MAKFYNKSIENLMKVIIKFKNEKDCFDFFSDLCTVKEIQDMAQRFNTAVMLNDGLSYQAISQKDGISTATISRVNRCLNYGSDGYKKAIKIFEEEIKNEN